MSQLSFAVFQFVAIALGWAGVLGLAGAVSAQPQTGSSPPTERSLNGQSRDITVPEPGSAKQAMVAIPLDSAVYANSKIGFDDLRILDGDDQEVPYILQRRVTQKVVTAQTTKRVSNLSLRPGEDDRLEIEWTVPENEPWNKIGGLTLVTLQRNFEHQLSVEWKPAGQESWQVVVPEARIYDYTQFMDVRDTTIRFENPVTKPAGGKLRLVIQAVTQEQYSNWMELTRRIRRGEEYDRQETQAINRQPLRLERIEVWQEQQVTKSTETELTTYPVETLESSVDPETKTTSITLSSNFQPVTEILLETEDDNFSRPFRVERLIDERRQLLADQTLSRIHLGTIAKEHLDIEFPEKRADRYFITIMNQDSPPLTDLRFQSRGPIYEVVFLGAADKTYRLVYGNRELSAPRYDTVALRSALSARTEPLAGELGEPQPLTFAPAEPTVSNWWTRPWFLGTIAVILVVALGFTLRHAAHRLEQIPE